MGSDAIPETGADADEMIGADTAQKQRGTRGARVIGREKLLRLSRSRVHERRWECNTPVYNKVPAVRLQYDQPTPSRDEHATFELKK